LADDIDGDNDADLSDDIDGGNDDLSDDVPFGMWMVRMLMSTLPPFPASPRDDFSADIDGDSEHDFVVLLLPSN